jgi:DNA polymerase-3 subunit chi
LLINLSASVPAYFAQFERVIELVTEDNKAQAREHYSYYKERGYPLKHVNL